MDYLTKSLGTLPNGKPVFYEKDLALIPRSEWGNVLLIDDQAYNIDLQKGTFYTKTSKGAVRYNFLKENGSKTVPASKYESFNDAKSQVASSSDYFASNSYKAPSRVDTNSQTGEKGETGEPIETGKGGAVTTKADIQELADSFEFQSLPEDQQELVRNVFQVIAENDIDNAERLAAAFETAEKVSDPFFKQQIRVARDAIERGFVSIDQEEQYKEKQLTKNLEDLKQDLETRKEFIGLEEQAALRGIEREYETTLKSTRQNLAARGMSSSSAREETEQLINETTGDLRESTKRKFGAQMTEALRTGDRAERDTQSEIERLRELTTGKKMELFRGAEETLGTAGLGDLNINQNLDPLGNLVGDIPQAQAKDIISGATQLIF